MGVGGVTGRKVSPPTPTYMTEDQKSNYLKELRSNRPSRPVGSRPAPFKTPHLARSDSAVSIESHENDAGNSASSRTSPGKGRPLASAPNQGTPNLRGRVASPAAAISRFATAPSEFSESTTRRLEKEESHTLRTALHLIDQRDEERRIYDAAQAEAADLVWKHRNPHAAEDELTAPYFNPDFQKTKGSASELGTPMKTRSRNVSDGSASGTDALTVSKPSSTTRDRVLSEALQELQVGSQERNVAIAASAKERRRSSGKRLVSGSSSKTLFRNPGDQIFEEPRSGRDGEGAATLSESPLKVRSSNSVPRDTRPSPLKALSTPAKRLPWLNRVEIHKNPPSQSRNAAYTSNTPPSVPRKDEIDKTDTPKSTSSLEIRSDDIRAATSMKKKDRSSKLPTPVAVSDLPGRPIVSFNPEWRPKESPRNSTDMDFSTVGASPRASRDLPRPVPPLSDSVPPIPAINISDGDTTGPVAETNLPLNAADIPTIRTEDAEDSGPSISVTAPSININDSPPERKAPCRPLPVHAATHPSPTKSSRPSWMNAHAALPTSVSCTACSLPISGRIVTAAGSKSTGVSLRARFHPDCFRCTHCSTRLEAVAFYPEPDEARRVRIDESEQPDVEETDTPIEGAVVNACGHTYHEDHFFCAECGDPFSSSTPFVEHNGYAYCLWAASGMNTALSVMNAGVTLEAKAASSSEMSLCGRRTRRDGKALPRKWKREQFVKPARKSDSRRELQMRTITYAHHNLDVEPATPPDLDIDHKAPLNGTIAAYQKHILVGSGQADWLSKIENEEHSSDWGRLIAELKRAVGRRGEFHDPATATATASGQSVFLFPAFQHLFLDQESPREQARNLAQYVLGDPDRPHPHIRTQPITQPTILICSHGGRDQRCGTLGQLLMHEFARQLCSIFPHTAATVPEGKIHVFDHQTINVCGVSHVGGHKWAGNSNKKVTSPLTGTGIWYGRVEPKHVQGIIEQTILRGKVIEDLFRGGIDRQGHPLRL
ncbi:hypothetical protein DV737_g2995, partial [Chaetothyriales sp. CBS 132003]